MSSQHKGIVTQIIGPVLDIRFAEGELPELRNAITIQHREQVITAEVAQHIGDNVVRCIAMNSTDGLVRGMEAIDTGAPISVPVGEECLGRIFNLLGEPIGQCIHINVDLLPCTAKRSKSETDIIQLRIRAVYLLHKLFVCDIFHQNQVLIPGHTIYICSMEILFQHFPDTDHYFISVISSKLLIKILKTVNIYRYCN